jgi:hypothetical protein
METEKCTLLHVQCYLDLLAREKRPASQAMSDQEAMLLLKYGDTWHRVRFDTEPIGPDSSRTYSVVEV